MTNENDPLVYLSKNNPFDDIEHQDYIMLLIDMARFKGEDSLEALAGFHIWAQTNICEDRRKHAIKSTFAHDLNERKNKTTLPRSSEYRFVWCDLFGNVKSTE